MRWFPVGVLGVHALIHLMGVFKAFGYVELAPLTQPISRAWGLGWLVAAGLVATTAAMLGAGSRSYWVVGVVALVVSQVVIVSAWRDAWAGTGANVISAAGGGARAAHRRPVELPRAVHPRRAARASRARVRLPSSWKPTWLGCRNPCSDTSV